MSNSLCVSRSHKKIETMAGFGSLAWSDGFLTPKAPKLSLKIAVFIKNRDLPAITIDKSVEIRNRY